MRYSCSSCCRCHVLVLFLCLSVTVLVATMCHNVGTEFLDFSCHPKASSCIVVGCRLCTFCTMSLQAPCCCDAFAPHELAWKVHVCMNVCMYACMYVFMLCYVMLFMLCCYVCNVWVCIVCMVCMVWYGMVWYGMVWYGMAWYGMVW